MESVLAQNGREDVENVNKIIKLNSEIDRYKKAIEDAEAALDDAERELDEILEDCRIDEPISE